MRVSKVMSSDVPGLLHCYAISQSSNTSNSKMVCSHPFQTVKQSRILPGLLLKHCFSGIIKIIRKAVFFMMTKNAGKKREQMMMFSMDSMVPQDHMLRLIDKAINWNFIYDLVEDKYCQNNGRPSMDPVMLVKIPFIQYLYGIKSMRQTIREIEVNVAYRWFLGDHGYTGSCTAFFNVWKELFPPI